MVFYIYGTNGPDNLLGTQSDDNIYGYGGSDTLNGRNGDDWLFGGSGNDKLIGGNGFNDYVGGSGYDTFTMSGRSAAADNFSDDVIWAFTFDVDHVNVAAWGVSDFGQIRDLLDYDAYGNAMLNAFYAGHDHVLAFDSISPGELIASDFIYSAAGAKNETGTSADDVLFGSAFADTLSGGAGNDWLLGGAGNDLLIGGLGVDFFDGGSGRDRVSYSYTSQALIIDLGTQTVSGPGPDEQLISIENATGSSGNDQIFGGAGANKLAGGPGHDILDGDRGNDVLTGGSGADAFLFDTPLNATTNVDAIVDFTPGIDEFWLDNAIFTALPGGPLAAAAFREGNFTAAQDGSDRIVYNDVTGAVYYDRDGVGGAAAVKFAIIDPGLSLSNTDFFVV